MVLGYNWLFCYNPLIDWITGKITFKPIISQNVSAPELPMTLAESSTIHSPARSPSPSVLLGKPSVTSSPKPSLPFPYEPIYEYPVQPSPFSAKLSADTSATAIDIRIVGAAAYLHSCSQAGSQQFTIQLNTPVATGQASSTTEPINLSNVPTGYHDFANVFSFEGAKTLPEHRPYDLHIDLEEGTKPPLGHLYSLSEAKLKALHEFISGIQGKPFCLLLLTFYLLFIYFSFSFLLTFWQEDKQK